MVSFVAQIVERPLTVRQVADILGVSPQTVVNYADAGTLKSFKLPSGHRRFHRSDIDKMLNKSGAAS